MKQTKRTRQVGDVIRSEIADLLRREIRDPDLGFVTVSDVEVSTDLKLARVFISVLGDEAAKAKSFAVLHRSRAHLRHLLAGRIHLRLVPALEFRPDAAIERGSRVEEILAEVLPRRGAAEPAADEPESDDNGGGNE